MAGAAEYIPVLIRKDLLKLSLQEAFLLIGLQMSATYLRIMPVTPLFGFFAQNVGAKIFPWFQLGMHGVYLAAFVSLGRVLHRLQANGRG